MTEVIVEIQDEKVRELNLLIAKNSTVFAGRSRSLVGSLAREC